MGSNNSVGILMAAGTGSRLKPLTLGVNKHFLPIFDKPMIYYSMSALLLAGVTDIVIVCNLEDLSKFQKLFGDGSFLGVNIDYKIQESARGIADAFNICESVIRNRPSVLVLGDNIFFGTGFSKKLQTAHSSLQGGHIFGYRVQDSKSFGVVELGDNNRIISIEEKPKKPKSDIAITGLYFFDETASDRVKSLKPSKRGELEIIDLLKSYQTDDRLNVEVLERGFAWLDTGTPESLLEASQFVEVIEKRQGFKIACLEEISFSQGWISQLQLKRQAKMHRNTQYGNYLELLAQKDQAADSYTKSLTSQNAQD